MPVFDIYTGKVMNQNPDPGDRKSPGYTECKKSRILDISRKSRDKNSDPEANSAL